jgi:hypothetical protein
LYIPRGEGGFCERASGPGIGPHLGRPVVFDPGRTEGVVQTVPEFVGDDGKDSRVSKAIVDGREELRGIHQLCLGAFRYEHGVRGGTVAEHHNLRAIDSAERFRGGIHATGQEHGVTGGALVR